MSEERFERWNDHSCKVRDNQEDTVLNWEDVVNKLNALAEENERLRSLHIDLLETIVKEPFYQEIFKEFLLENSDVLIKEE